MMCLSKWIGAAMLSSALLAGNATAADTVAAGRVKSINADNKTFVLTDAGEKDFTMKLGENLVVNRVGKESKSDLKAGDVIHVCYDKGILNWTAHYILVKEGKAVNTGLIRGNVKSYDPAKKELTFTNESDQTSTYAVGDASVRVNMEDSKIDNAKIGDDALIIVETVNEKPILRSVMIKRVK